MSEQKVEMSKLNMRMPRYYKGYDVDVILTKIKKQEQLTDNEENIYWEMQDIYYPAEEIPKKFPANARVNYHDPSILDGLRDRK